MSAFRVLISTTPRAIQAEQLRFVRQLQQAARQTADTVAIASQKMIRSQMTGQGLGKFARVVRVTSDLRKRQQQIPSLGLRWKAGAAVFRRTDKGPRTQGAWQAYTTGPMIVPKRGKWLAFPTANAPKRVGRRKITPALYRNQPSAGPLRFVPGARPGVAYLVADKVSVPSGNRSGRARSLGKRGGAGSGRVKREFVIMFILIRRTKRDIRFRPEQIIRAQWARAPGMLRANLLRRRQGAAPGTRSGFIAGSSGTGTGRLGAFRL